MKQEPFSFSNAKTAILIKIPNQIHVNYMNIKKRQKKKKNVVFGRLLQTCYVGLCRSYVHRIINSRFYCCQICITNEKQPVASTIACRQFLAKNILFAVYCINLMAGVWILFCKIYFNFLDFYLSFLFSSEFSL